jgi:signal transducer and activator of transcription 5B
MNSGFLDTLQEWCEGLADIIWQLRQQVRQLEGLKAKLMSDPQNKDCNLQELLASVTELLSNLVTGTFVIEKQPPQVMKTNTRFTSTVRLLVSMV